MEEGTLAKWLVKEGDIITLGKVIAEIETDKATMEYEAPETGTLVQLLVPEGSANVAVDAPIALLAVEGEHVTSVAADKVDVPSALAASSVKPGSAPADPAELRGSVSASSAAPTGGRIAASPLARRIAAAQGLDLALISGSGPNGRVVRRDIEEAASIQAAAVSSASSATPAARTGSAVEELYQRGRYEVIELDAMRRTIARRLTESKQTVPHFYLRIDAELDSALALRERINAAAPIRDGGKPAWRISVNDMMIKALACALRDVPEANVTWADGYMLRHKAVDVAVAVAIDGGLITPIIRDAGTKSLSVISTEMKDLAARARERKLAPEEYQGGTTSLSNLGMLGVSSFDAVINPPHGTILATGAAEKRPVVRDDALSIATMVTVTLSVDHRTVDGALGARLLAAFKQLVEQPLVLLA